MNACIQANLLTARMVRQQVPVSDMSLWRWVRSGKFPAPLKVAGRNYWRADEIDGWLAERSEARNREAA